jgi:putative transposase
MFLDRTDLAEQQNCYSLTLTVYGSIDIFTRPVLKQIIVESLNYFINKKGLSVHGWCLMTNHLNLLATTDHEINIVMDDFKRFTSKIILQHLDVDSQKRGNWLIEKFKTSGPASVWESELNIAKIDTRFSETVTDKLEQIHSAPVRDRIVLLAQDYLYSSAKDYRGAEGLVRIKPLSIAETLGNDIQHSTIYNMMWYR